MTPVSNTEAEFLRSALIVNYLSLYTVLLFIVPIAPSITAFVIAAPRKSPPQPRSSSQFLPIPPAMQLGLSENLSALVARRFTAAKDGGNLIFSSTHVSIITTAGIPVCSRLLHLRVSRKETLSHTAQYPVPTPLLPSSCHEAPRPQQKPFTRPQIQENRPFRESVSGLAPRKLPPFKSNPRPRLEQIPRHPQSLHPRHKSLESPNRPPRTHRPRSNIRLPPRLGQPHQPNRKQIHLPPPLRLLQLRRRQRRQPITPAPPISPRRSNAPTRHYRILDALDRPPHSPTTQPPDLPIPPRPPLRTLRPPAPAQSEPRHFTRNIHRAVPRCRRRAAGPRPARRSAGHSYAGPVGDKL